MGYEVLGATADRSPAGRPTISVQPNGVVRVNSEATKVLKNLGAERVLLLWDKEKRRVAVAAATKNDARSYKLRVDPKKGVAQFAAKAAMRHIGWIAERSVRIPVRLVEKMLEGTIPAENLQRGGASDLAKAKRNPGRSGTRHVNADRTDAPGTESV